MATSIVWLLIMITIITLVRLLRRYSNSPSEVERIRDLCARAASEHVERTAVTPRSAPARLTAAQNARIVELYEIGWRPVDIAREVQTTEWTIHRRLNRAGVQRRPQSMTPEQIGYAASLRGDGLSYDKIAARVGFSASTIRNMLRDTNSVSFHPSSGISAQAP